MSKIQDAVALIAGNTKLDENNIIPEITHWNKAKSYPMSLINIQIDGNGVKDNSDFIGTIVAKIEEAVKDTVANELDLENVADMKKTVAEIGKWFIETRKIQTNPLKDVASRYTAFESKFGTFNTDLTNKIDAINEKEYQKAEKAIREYFDELLGSDENKDIEIEMTLFDSFIQSKRKTKVTLDGKLNEGTLTKKAKDEIAEQVRLAIEPIRKAKELEAKKSLQSKQFENTLVRITTEGANEELNKSIDELDRLKIQVEELYPDVIDYCQRAIDNKISFAKANIKANDAVESRKAVENVDNKFMEEFSRLESETKDLTLVHANLKSIQQRLRELYQLVKFAGNQEKIKILGASVSLRISELERKEIEVSVAPTEVKAEAAIKTKNIYSVSIEDIEVIAGMEIEANSEEEAKKELCRRFEAHLSMVDLIIKGE
ncbi:MAG: hypothetical protein ACWGHH_06670 [Sulfurovaceae bacterium]